MTAIIISLVLSVLILLVKQRGRSIKFRILSFLICAIICTTLILLTDLGWWNVVVLPVCTFIGIFVSLIISPLTVKEAYSGKSFKVNDYYNELPNGEQIGTINYYYGFKQGYERLLNKILYAFTSSNVDAQRIMQNLYSNIYYPSSKISKETLVNHIHTSLDDVINGSNYLIQMKINNPNIYEYVFNLFICILQINEEATDNVKKLEEK
ncbi:hypothetical protein [uncultured Draconibacterium sp.]|uniref:hypothetical protein n=1 Tax=uncultured Draconibacterium sp. TaxID=1573823 RepID=UPI0032173AFF